MPDFLPPAPAPVLTVSALNQAVARMLEQSFALTWIGGEVSNFTRAASGHWYFTLKDSAAQVRAVMFRGRAQYAGFMPREGDKVEVRAQVSLYAPRGDYQLGVEAIRRAGVGSLFEAFVQLKEKLTREGLFAAEKKRPLPFFVKTIGIVTSLQAAALRDVLSALARRAPHVGVIIYPSPVQGAGAADKIAAAISLASRRAECEVLLVCRGGGSIEDLWSFNEEVVARAIAAASMPVISGVGHETDFTIADFSADLRAPTPTAAAEMATVPTADWRAALAGHAGDMRRATVRALATAQQTLDRHARGLISPAAYIGRERAKLQVLALRIRQAQRHPLHAARQTLQHLRLRLAPPDTRLWRQALLSLQSRAQASTQRTVGQRRLALAALSAQLELLNPQRTLERGYAIVTDHKGQIVRARTQLQARQTIHLRLADGSAQVDIANVQSELD